MSAISPRPVIAFAAVRVLLVGGTLLGSLAIGFPHEKTLAVVLASTALPWALLVLVLTRRAPTENPQPWQALGDVIAFAILEAFVPEVYGPVRFIALFFVGMHSYFQGVRVGLAMALGISVSLSVITVSTNGPVEDDTLLFYEPLFALVALSAAALLGQVRSAEMVDRLRARGLTRRAYEAEDDVRRHIAGVIHDGPVQELASLEMMLAAADGAAERGEHSRTRGLLAEARDVAARNVRTLRAEIAWLGPGDRGTSFETALDSAVPNWHRRFGFQVVAHTDPLDLPQGVEGTLFRIATEAVTNAGLHSGADRVSVSLAANGSALILEVVDDGHGFARDPFARGEAGHLGVLTMQERAESIGGTLSIDTGPEGTRVAVHVSNQV